MAAVAAWVPVEKRPAPISPARRIRPSWSKPSIAEPHGYSGRGPWLGIATRVTAALAPCPTPEVPSGVRLDAGAPYPGWAHAFKGRRLQGRDKDLEIGRAHV